MFAIVILGIDLEDAHDQRFDVLDVQVETDRIARREEFGIGRNKVEIDPVLQCLVSIRREQRVPLLGLAQPIHDLRFGQIVPQIDIADERLVGRRHRFVDKEVMEVAADQRLVVSNRRQQREGFIIYVKIRGITPVFALLEKPGFDVRHIPRQADVSHEAIFVIDAASAIKRQPMEEYVRFERIVYRSQSRNESP